MGKNITDNESPHLSKSGDFLIKNKQPLNEGRKVTISESLTQQRLLEIMGKIYVKGEESEKITAIELIEEIKQYVIQDK